MALRPIRAIRAPSFEGLGSLFDEIGARADERREEEEITSLLEAALAEEMPPATLGAIDSGTRDLGDGRAIDVTRGVGRDTALARLAQISPQAAQTAVGILNSRNAQAAQQAAQRADQIALDSIALRDADPESRRLVAQRIIQRRLGEGDEAGARSIAETLTLPEDVQQLTYQGDILRSETFRDVLDSETKVLSPGDVLVDERGNVVGEGGAAPEDLTEIRNLRKEFTNATQDFAKQNASYGRILASAEDPSAAGDLALIFNYMKLLDPGSVVREGEFATAQNAAGVPGRVQSLYNNVLRGERLNPGQRADFVDRSGRLFNEAVGQHNRTVGEFRRIAEESNLDPDLVIFERNIVNERGIDSSEDGLTPEERARLAELRAKRDQ